VDRGESMVLQERGVRPYVCTTCRTPFKSPEDLGGHLMTLETTGVCEKPLDPRENAPPTCPKCETVATKLKFDGYGTNWRCAKGGCGHEFRVVAGRTVADRQNPLQPAPLPQSPALPQPRGTEQEKPMSNTDSKLILTCSKGCRREFVHEAWKAKHEEKCNGTSKRRADAEPSEKRSTRAAATGVSAIQRAIEALQERRAAAVQQIVELDQVIEKLVGLDCK
jgi:hypothetical protein